MSVQDTMLVEKYRPESLDDIIGNDLIVDRFKNWVDDPSLPNVLLSGPQGVGKTAMAVAFAKEKYGDEWGSFVLQLNASDERGIGTVRKKIKSEFAQMSMVGNADYKIVILDEADALTNDAQTALRRVMEDYHDVTRFFLLCNYPGKLIDPIQSRCAPFRMQPLELEQVRDLLARICEQEGYAYTPDQLLEIAQAADGDARISIQMLQTCVVNGQVEEKYITVMRRGVSKSDVEEIVDEAVNGNSDRAMELMDDLIGKGISPMELCESFVTVIDEYDEIPKDGQKKMISKVADAEWRITNGSSPYTQLHSLVADLEIARWLSLEPYRRAEMEEQR